MLAHNAVMVGLAIDPVALYGTDDRSFLLWLDTLIERIHRTQEDAARRNH